MALSVKAKVARKSFRSQYSKTTADVIQQIARGRDSYEIADRVGVSMRSVATTRGNLTRGLYSPYAVVRNGNVQGECQF
jgi:FixJ family two-component response regulator